jgi:hypothetical protein
MATSALEKIKAIQEKARKEIEAIKDEARSELSKRIGKAREHLRSLEAEYAALIGRNVRGEKVKKPALDGGGPKADVGDKKELADILQKAEGNKLNRKGFNDLGYNLVSAIRLAKEDPKKFGFRQNRAQGEVWLK